MKIRQACITEAERFTGGKVLYWSTDGEGEFGDRVLGSYFIGNSISVQKTMLFFCEQNRNIERANRTVQATMRVLLEDV